MGTTPTAKVRPQDHAVYEQVRRPDLSNYLDTARKRLGIEINDIAIDWHVDPRYVSRVLSGEKPLPDYRVAQLPIELQRAMVVEWCRDLQMLVGRKVALIDAVAALNALMQEDNVPAERPKMLKADLPAAKKDRTA